MADSLLHRLALELQPEAPPDADIPDDYEGWLTALFPVYVRAGFGDHHHQLWRWLWSIQPGIVPRPFVAIWPRGGGKSTSAELGAVALGARGIRRYIWYVSGTQRQADDHVATLAGLLESPQIAALYPALGTRMVGRYGNVRGWSRQRLRTAAGFTIDALGLDVHALITKIDEQRPDALILDDVDDEIDSAAETERKIVAFTRKLLPACTPDVAILAVQNLVSEDGIFARLAGRSQTKIDWLSNRIVSGPHPALTDFDYEERPEGGYQITAGTPIWQGQGIAECQAFIDIWGLSAFRTEAQHEVGVKEGGIFSHLSFRRCAPEEVPDLVRVVVAVDPAVSDTDFSDSHGVQCDGIAAPTVDHLGKRIPGTVYRLFSWERRASPDLALKTAILAALRYGAGAVIVETDQGGDLWRGAYNAAWDDLVEKGDIELVQGPDGRWSLPNKPTFRPEKAGAGHGPKIHRAQTMLEDYDTGKIVHVLGSHLTLERALRRFPAEKPFDLVDAAYWSWLRLRRAGQGFA